MIIPIGHENSEVRRQPWVTFTIIAICTLALIGSQGNESEIVADLDVTATRLREYVESHPYLELDARVDDLLFAGFDDEERDQLFAAWLEESPEPFEFQMQDEQRELDAMQQSLLARFDDLPYRRYGVVPADPSATGWLTHLFVHGGWMHLLGNMFLLYLAGTCIEDVWGRPLFGAFYLLAGVAGAAFFALQYPDSTIPLVGASGAVSGILGAFLVRYWSTQIKFFYWIALVFRGTFSAPAYLMLPLWFANEWLSASVMDTVAPGSGGGIAHWAHVGGFAFGVAGSFVIKKFEIEERYLRPALDSKIDIVKNVALEEAMVAKQAGKTDQAFARLEREARTQPSNIDAAVTFWELAIELGRAREAAPALVRVLRADVQANDTARALERLGELERHARGVALEPAVLLRLATALAKDGRNLEAASVLRRALPDSGTPIPSAVAVRIANTARAIDPGVAARAARIALDSRDLDPRERTNLQAIAASGGAAGASAPQRTTTPIDVGPPAHLAATPTRVPAPTPEPWSLGEEEPAPVFDPARTARRSPPPTPELAREPALAPPSRDVAAENALAVFDHAALDLGDASSDDAPLELDSPGGAAPDASAQRAFQDTDALDLESGDEGGAGFLRPPDPDEEKNES